MGAPILIPLSQDGSSKGGSLNSNDELPILKEAQYVPVSIVGSVIRREIE